MSETLAYYQSIESFGSVDGPGVRSILFLQGCEMRCLFCHNPDTWEKNVGKRITASVAFEKLSRYRPYWRNNGGITVSGGEPLLQLSFLIELGKICHRNGVTLVLDTAGQPFTREEPFFSLFQELLKNSDLFLLDIKSIDPLVHRRLTGKDNANILDLFRYLSEADYPIWVRQVLVPGITDDERLLKETHDFLKTLRNIQRVEVLPYHTLGVYKYEKLGIPYALKGVNPPTSQQVRRAEQILDTESYSGYLSSPKPLLR
jgi:pyruvate formate lyase activating enzyme